MTVKAFAAGPGTVFGTVSAGIGGKFSEIEAGGASGTELALDRGRSPVVLTCSSEDAFCDGCFSLRVAKELFESSARLGTTSALTFGAAGGNGAVAAVRTR
jgi:hypothetical protein